jgi:hypothetical protein
MSSVLKRFLLILPRLSGAGSLPQQSEKFLYRQIVDYEKLDQGFLGDVGPAVFDTPVLHSGEFVIERKTFKALVPLFLSEFLELLADPLDQVIQDFIFFHKWKVENEPLWVLHHQWYFVVLQPHGVLSPYSISHPKHPYLL